MSPFARLRLRLLLLARSERGMALPVALFAMISSMALASAAVVATVDVQQGSKRDSSAKSAIAAADAGAKIAQVRQSRYAYILNRNTPCLKLGTSGMIERSPAEAVGGSSWCPEVTGTVGGASYAYRVSPVGLSCGSYELCVVSTGTDDEVSRRIEVTYNRSGLVTNESELTSETKRLQEEQTKKELKEAIEKEEKQKIKELEEKEAKEKEEKASGGGIEGFVGREGITLSGNADIRVGVGTNGDLVTSGNASICGDIRHGIGKKWSKSGNAKQCTGYHVNEGNIDLPPVVSFMPANIAVSNSNYRLVTCTSAGKPAGCQSDTLSGGKWSSTSPWKSSTRAISLSGNSTLTVGGGDYWVCSISFSGNSQLIMAEGARVRFFFDTPEHCGYNGNQLSLSGNNRIAATGYQPDDGQFEMPGFYFLGSPTVASQINLSGNYSTTNEMIVYAPDTYINISGNATFKGVIAGKQIAMSGNGKVEQDAGFVLPPELNPGAEEEDDGGDGGDGEEESSEETSEEEESSEEESVIEVTENGVSTKTNTVANYFTPQAYFECSGLPGPGEPPNASC